MAAGPSWSAASTAWLDTSWQHSRRFAAQAFTCYAGKSCAEVRPTGDLAIMPATRRSPSGENPVFDPDRRRRNPPGNAQAPGTAGSKTSSGERLFFPVYLGVQPTEGVRRN